MTKTTPVTELAPATEFAQELLTRLVELGVEHVVLSPGSRSQALALTATALEQRGDISLHVRIDERVAGFVAVGIGKETVKPAAVITTSGTAVANLHPAVLEAHHAGVPLILLTADRPDEARGIGTNQTTDQHDLFGNAVRLSVDEPAPVPGATTTRRAAELAQQAWQAATDAHAPGPVHLNLAFREPLSSRLQLRQIRRRESQSSSVRPAVSLELERGPRTLVIAGADAGPAAEELAHVGGWPLIAEVSSGSRYGRNLVACYREVLGLTELTEQIERIVVFGHPTLSREVPRLIGDTTSGIDTIVVRGPAAEGYNPGHNVASFVDEVSVAPGDIDEDWLALWMRTSRALRNDYDKRLSEEVGGALTPPDVEASHSTDVEDMRTFVQAELAASRTPLTRELLVDALWRVTWPHDRLLFAASRLIRAADTHVGGKKITVYANRGLAGIDGTIATATGVALASGLLTRVLVGDLAAVHDAGALALSKGETRPRLQVIVGNDDGGTIFDTLEVAQSAPAGHMLRAFRTQQVVDFEKLAHAFGWNYVSVSTVGDLERALTGMGDGPEIVEVKLQT